LRHLGAALIVVLLITPAYSAGGWYLMRPPYDAVEKQAHDPNVHSLLDVRIKEPLAEWDTADAYDSAQTCQRGWSQHFESALQHNAGMQNALEDALKAGDTDPTKLERLRRGYGRAFVEGWRAYLSKCIATDDPRLK